MNRQSGLRYVSPLLLLVFAGMLNAWADDPAAKAGACSATLRLPDSVIAERLMQHNARRAEQLRGFEGVRHYSVEYTGIGSTKAGMDVKLLYTAPGEKKFTIQSESGSKLLIGRVLKRLLETEQEAGSDQANRDAVALSTSNYRLTLLGCEPAEARDLYVMKIEPLRNSKFLYRGTLWIDSQDYAVTRIDAEPAKNPSFWIKRTRILQHYQKIEGFYLPELNQTESDIRLGGKALLTIRYQDYKLASGAAALAVPPAPR